MYKRYCLCEVVQLNKLLLGTAPFHKSWLLIVLHVEKVKVKRKSVVQENQEEEPATTTAVKPATAHINRGGQDVDRITFSMSNKDCEKCGEIMYKYI